MPRGEPSKHRETLRRRVDWLTARVAVQEDAGNSRDFDRAELAALRYAIAHLQDALPLRDELAALKRRVEAQAAELRRNEEWNRRLREVIARAAVELPERN